MNPREFVDHIRSGPAKLALNKPLRFRRRTRSNPCDFNDFLQAVRSSQTIRISKCSSHTDLEITEDEWVLLVTTLGTMKGIEGLTLSCKPGSLDFHPFQAIAEAVSNAQSLRILLISSYYAPCPSDTYGMIALANVLREHTALEAFGWADACSLVQLEAFQSTALDLVLWSLPTCTHLRMVSITTKCASVDALKNLLQMHSATELRLILKTDHWLAVADEIEQGRCNIHELTLCMNQGRISEATLAVKAVASAIRLDCNLEHLVLRMENGFTDEACVALAEALKVNKKLRRLKLCNIAERGSRNVGNIDSFGARSYEAFAVMLRVNTNIVLEFPPLGRAVHDELIFESCSQMRIEQQLNKVGRGKLLSSSQATKKEWIDALHELSSIQFGYDESNAFRLSCIFSLFRLNPEVVSMS
jgi:hypothetical protein